MGKVCAMMCCAAVVAQPEAGTPSDVKPSARSCDTFVFAGDGGLSVVTMQRSKQWRRGRGRRLGGG